MHAELGRDTVTNACPNSHDQIIHRYAAGGCSTSGESPTLLAPLCSSKLIWQITRCILSHCSSPTAGLNLPKWKNEMLQDLPCILAAMIPCTRLYAYIGCQLRAAALAAPTIIRAQGPYASWIKEYSSDAFLGLPASKEALLDKLGPAVPYGNHCYSCARILHHCPRDARSLDKKYHVHCRSNFLYFFLGNLNLLACNRFC